MSDIKIYTDGSRIPKAGSGYSVYIPKIKLMVYGPTPDAPNDIVTAKILSNNRGELHAILRAIELIDEYDLKNVTIYSDSEYSVKAITDWAARIWRAKASNPADHKTWIKADKSPIANSDQISRALEAYEKGKYKLLHIRAHSGNKDNDLADKFAKKGVYETTEKIIFIE